ncbi:hypothetical protein GGI35DRAFT_436934 [Trichoderma velutinum]
MIVIGDTALHGLALIKVTTSYSFPWFDFALKFEQSILTITSCTYFSICVLPLSVHLLQESPKVIRTPVGVIQYI